MWENISQRKDEEIANLVQSGKIEFFDILIERYEAKIKRYSRKFLSDSESINDVLQEIFIKVYTNIQSFDSKRKFSSWIYRIAHNELVNVLRKRRPILPLFDLDVFLPHRLHDDTFRENIDRQSIKEIIDKCLDRLEVKYKEPLVLYYFEELSYQEIADILQIPVSTVGIRIKRAKEKVKTIYRQITSNDGK
jgi:RNA polymerase sigma-70 factor (ECF subfamily)